MTRGLLWTLVLIGLGACTPALLAETQLSQDLQAQSYVQNCVQQGLTLRETQVVSQEVKQSVLEVLMALQFEGTQTPQTRTLLCLPTSTVKLRYQQEKGQWVFDRLSLELSRTQLNDHVRAPLP